jgi:hypothetical protein
VALVIPITGESATTLNLEQSETGVVRLIKQDRLDRDTKPCPMVYGRASLDLGLSHLSWKS